MCAAKRGSVALYLPGGRLGQADEAGGVLRQRQVLFVTGKCSSRYTSKASLLQFTRSSVPQGQFVTGES